MLLPMKRPPVSAGEKYKGRIYGYAEIVDVDEWEDPYVGPQYSIRYTGHDGAASGSLSPFEFAQAYGERI